MDLASTMVARRPQHDAGLLVAADGGVLEVRMAERLRDDQVAAVAAAIDTGMHRVERDGCSAQHSARFQVIALDESESDEPEFAPALAERLGLVVDLHAIPQSVVALTPELELLGDEADVARARAAFAAMDASASASEALCHLAVRLGITSLRAPLLAERVARAAAALASLEAPGQDELELAASLVLAPRAQQWPELAEEQAEPPADDAESSQSSAREDSAPDDAEEQEAPDPEALAELLLSALSARLPQDLLTRQLARQRRRGEGPAGRAGPRRLSFLRGAPRGALALPLDGRRRLDVSATLRAAAPWQALRREQDDAGSQGSGVALDPDDVRVRRFVQQAAVVTIFLVDASGSAAVQRLGEVKGAVERLLSECYVRRDQVALIAFRGRGAELLLSPTRSLVRAKRALGALPGGGGTPLAAGLRLGWLEAQRVLRSGAVPMLVLLSDGRPNVTLAGVGNRSEALREANAWAGQLQASRLSTLVIDSSARGQPFLENLAVAADAEYLRLPVADNEQLSQAVGRFTGVGR